MTMYTRFYFFRQPRNFPLSGLLHCLKKKKNSFSRVTHRVDTSFIVSVGDALKSEKRHYERATPVRRYSVINDPPRLMLE